MTGPGSGMRARLARWVAPSTMERVIDPAVADLQFDLARLGHAGRVCRTWRRVVGTAMVIRTVLAFAALRPVHAVQDLTAAEWQQIGLAATRVLLAGVLMTAAFTLWPFVTLRSIGASVPPAALVLLIPQAVPLALPAALVAAAMLTRRAALSRPHVQIAFACLSLVAAVASLTLLAETIPIANQAFREWGFGRPAGRGLAELTLAELWRVGRGGVAPVDLMLPIDRPAASAFFHLRLALAVAPLLLTTVVFSLMARPDRRWVSGALAATITAGYYSAMNLLAMDTPVTAPALVMWAPSGALLALAALSRYGATKFPATNV
jgi:hypothetical protein